MAQPASGALKSELDGSGSVTKLLLRFTVAGIVVMFLQPMGWRLTMVENGLEAVEAAKAEAFDVILMDMQMPLMSGVEATQAIRDGGGVNAATPVVALTANALGHHRDMWTAVGVDAFLTKPIDPRLLVSTLAAAGARKPSRQPRATQVA